MSDKHTYTIDEIKELVGWILERERDQCLSKERMELMLGHIATAILRSSSSSGWVRVSVDTDVFDAVGVDSPIGPQSYERSRKNRLRSNA